jgi:hypothetical protein
MDSLSADRTHKLLADSAQIEAAPHTHWRRLMISRLRRPKPILTGKKIPPHPFWGVTIAGTLMASLCAAGCGGSSRSTTSTPPAAITKAEFVEKANAICARSDPALLAAGVKLASHPTDAQIAALVRGTYVPSIQAQITGIRALGAPAGEQATLTSMLSLVQADLNRLKSSPALIATDVFADFATVAHPYGLTACAPTS